MGVYIKGMTIEQLRRMGVAGIILSEERLVEVKEPHGRLADIDKLMKEYGMASLCDECTTDAGKCINGYFTYSKDDVCVLIDNAPTVIEAESE